MKIIAVILFSFFSAFICAYIITKKENLSAKPLFFIFSFSLSAVIISILFQTAVNFVFLDFLHSCNSIPVILFESFVISSLIEECIKTLIFFIFLKFLWATKIMKFDENLPGDMRAQVRVLLLLSIFYGFIFASFETLAYTIKSGDFFIIRLITSNFLHAAFGVYYLQIGMAQKLKKRIVPFFSAWILHGLYNMFLSIGIIFSFFSAMIVLFSIGNALKQYGKFKEN